MKLAKAAAQQLKAVVVEYDVLCSTLLGKSAADQAEQQRRKVAMAADRQRNSTLFSASSVQSLLVSDVRELLKRLDKDATGKPWAVKERLQNTLKGLPSECALDVCVCVWSACNVTGRLRDVLVQF